MRAQALDAQTIEVVFEIAKDYYLYGDKFRFEAEPAGVGFGAPEKPAGKKHKDDFFGEVETHRGELRILVPVQAPAGSTRFELFATRQGCWDGGICYPPTTQQASIDLTAPPKKAGGFLDSVLGGRAGAGNAASSTPAALAGDDRRRSRKRGRLRLQRRDRRHRPPALRRQRADHPAQLLRLRPAARLHRRAPSR